MWSAQSFLSVATDRDVAWEPPATTATRIIRFLHEYAGKEFCNRCLAKRLLGGRDTDAAMRYVEARGITRHYGRCSECEKPRLVAGIISTFLEETTRTESDTASGDDSPAIAEE